MERNRFWIIIGVATALGLAIELAKGPAGDRFKQTGSLHTALHDLEDDRIENLDEARAGRIEGAATAAPARLSRGKNKPSTLAGLDGSASPNKATTGNEGDSAGPAATSAGELKKAATKADAAATDKAKDDATNKGKDKDKDKDKKSKKKKKKKTANDEAPSPATPEDSADASGTDSSPEMGGGQRVPPGANTQVASPGQAPGEPSEIPETQAEWESLLLREPDFQGTQKLIQYYSGGLISADVFYGVVRVMIEDSRPKMRQLGLLALGATPSVRSFAELTLTVESEAGATPIKDQARAYMRAYTDLPRLRLLAGAMQLKSSPNVAIEAMRHLRISAEHHLKALAQQKRDPADNTQGGAPPAQGGDPSSGSGIGSGNAQQTPTVTANSRARKFNAESQFRIIADLLKRLRSSFSEPDLKDAADQTLALLESYLPSSAQASGQEQSEGQMVGNGSTPNVNPS